MANLRAAVAVIERAASGPDQRRRPVTPPQLYTIIAIALQGLLVVAVYTASRLLIAWRTGGDGWTAFWANPLYSVPGLAVALLALGGVSNRLLLVRDQIIAVLDAALADDGAQVPLAAQQPAPALGDALYSPDLLADGRRTITPLIRPRRAHWPISVAVDGAGLHWRETTGLGRSRHIAWSQARMFLTFSWRSDSTYTNYEIFALIGSSAVFTWQMTQRSTPDEQQAHKELAGLIAARTGLLLRDLTRELEAAVVLPAAAEKPKIRFPLGKPGTPDAVPGVPPVSTDPAPREVAARAHRRQVHLRVLFAATITPLLLLDGAGFILQHAQPGVFAAYVARAEAQPALYRDTLSWFNAEIDWQAANNGKPTGYSSDGGPEYTYTHTTPDGVVYQSVSGPPDASGIGFGPIGPAWESRSFGDVVVEATVIQRPPLYDIDAVPDPAGIVFRSSSDAKVMLRFMVDQSGSWYVYEVRDNPYGGSPFNESGRSDAIRLGDPAINRLAVIMRGDQFLCFINGTFVAGFTDSLARATGVIGLFTLGGPRFSNLAVYPLPAASPPLLWDQ